jgi:predicted dehydrogenase
MTKLALIGFGRWGKNLARVMNELGVLGAIVDESKDVLTDAMVRYPEVLHYRVYSTYVDVWIQQGITGVVLATPAETHYGVANFHMVMGFDVFTEKPMALSSREANAMILSAEEHKKKLFVGHVFEYHPAVVRIVELVKAGYLGDVEYISSYQLGPGKVRNKENVIFSLAPHDVSMILRIMGSTGTIGILPKRVSAFGVSHCADVAGTAAINIDFGMTQALVHVSWMNPQKRRQLTVVGSKRSIVFDDVAKKLMVYDRTGDINAYDKDGSEIFYDSVTEPLKIEMEAFVKYIETGEEPPTTGEKALRVVQVLEAAQQSMVKGSIPIDVLG